MSDEEIDDSEEDENDSALDSSTSCESQLHKSICSQHLISKSQIITIQYNSLTGNDCQIRKINVFLILWCCSVTLDRKNYIYNNLKKSLLHRNGTKLGLHTKTSRPGFTDRA